MNLNVSKTTRAPVVDARGIASSMVTPLVPLQEVCDVTLPNGENPSYRTPREYSHGNGYIFTLLPLNEDREFEVLYREESHTGFSKWLWFLEGTVGPMQAELVRIGADNYTETSAVAFEPSLPESRQFVAGLAFADEGCWQLTGKTSDQVLTVTLDVRFVSDCA